MKALVLWAESASTNLGVRALAEGTGKLIGRSFPGVLLESQGFGPGDAPVRIGAPRPQLQRLLTPHDELVDWVHQFDLVVDTGAGDSFADIYGIMEYFIGNENVGLAGHDDVAEKIATEGKEWTERVLRKEDMQIYVMRLLLEYARLCDDERDVLGWAMGVNATAET